MINLQIIPEGDPDSLAKILYNKEFGFNSQKISEYLY